jgi:hypothetical protein
MSRDNRSPLQALVFQFFIFPVLVMFLREMFRQTINEFKKNEGDFSSEQGDIQKPTPVFTETS